MKLFIKIERSHAVRALARKYPMFYQWLLRRVSIKKFTGLPLLVLIIVFLFNSLLLAKITEDVFNSEAIIQIDKKASEIIGPLQMPFLLKVFYVITQFASRFIVIPLFISTIIFLYITKRLNYILGLCISVFGTGISISLGKIFVKRIRPDIFQYYKESSFSFPSGHSAIAVALYGFITYILWREIKSKKIKMSSIIFGVFLIIAIGFGRLYLEVHFLSDVLAGWSLGFLWLLLAVSIVEYTKSKKISNT